MSNQGLDKASNYISYILLLLIIIGIVGLLAFSTNGFKDDLSTFGVVIEDSKLFGKNNGYEVSDDKPLRANVIYAFDVLKINEKGYKLKIVPNKISGKDFSINNGKTDIAYQSIDDLSNCFYIETTEDSFVISPKGNINEMLSYAVGGNVVGDYVPYLYKDMFSLEVSSIDGIDKVVINFTLFSDVVTNIV